MQEDEPARKVAKTHLPSDVSERRVRAEVQAMLVGADLAATTLGELRGDLEGRLGLESGFLASRSSLQRWVGGVIQHEVVKRGQRSGYCERVAKALVEFEDYPREARQMLIESLPHAIPENGGPPHTHQAQLLAIARDALGNAKGAARRAQAEFLGRTQPEAAALDALVGECDAAARREAAALEAAEAAAQSLRDAEKEVWLTKQQLQGAEDAVQAAHDELRRVGKAREEAAALCCGAFQQLLDGALPKDERAAGIAKVTDFVQQESAPASLHASAPIALGRDPEARSNFEKTIIDALKALFVEHESRAQQQLAVEPELTLGPAVTGARASVEVAEARVAEQTAARDRAQAAWETAAGEQRAAAAVVSEKQESDQPRLAEQERHANKVKELDGIMEVLEGHLAAGPKSHAIPTGNDDVGFTSPRKVATPMSERGMRYGAPELEAA